MAADADIAGKFAEALRRGEVRHYRKHARVDIRPAVPGEKVETVIGGERETVNTAGRGDYVVRGVQGEEYIIKGKTLAARYGPPLTGPKEEGFREYGATGDFFAFRYDGEPIEFIAPWGETTIANPGDYIGTIAIGSNEYYRVEKNAFAATYVPMADGRPARASSAPLKDGGKAMLKRPDRDLTMADAARGPGGSRVDLLVVAHMVEAGARVLDVGCGDGELLQLLETRGVDGRGIELSREGVNECVAKGLAVVQGDADTDLADYPNDAFDYVILSQTLQATRQPRVVLEHMLRIGRYGIVSFPNFGHWNIRMQLLFGGHMPRTDNLPYAWYETPNIHFCSIKDFRDLCLAAGAKMDQAVALNAWGRQMRLKMPWWFWNLFGEQAVFLLSRRGNSPAI